MLKASINGCLKGETIMKITEEKSDNVFIAAMLTALLDKQIPEAAKRM